mmetsp:Transcript_21934/g.44150  ORF Transcript_21934/g.44150 Transcript_21934/m.44150 type:complete len:205 (+) Transcript_21934:1848-2462(+)
MIRLEKVIHITRVRRPLPRIRKRQRRIPPNQHRHRPRSTRRTRRTPRVSGDIHGHDDGIPSIPSVAFHPGKRIQQRGRPAVTGVDDGGSLDIGIPIEQIHQDSLGALGFVHERLGAHFEAAHGMGIDGVLLQEGVDDGEGHGVDVFGVSRDGQGFLAQAQGVFAGGDARVFFEGGLGNVSAGGVHFDAEDADVFAVAAGGAIRG